MRRFVIGVDGGGTHTRAVVLDESGRELGRADGRAAVADARTPRTAADAVADVCAAAVAAAGRSLPVDSLWAGLSGAGREAARSAVQMELTRMGVASEVRVDTDVAAAFHDAFGDGPGILLISGTGSIAWGRAEDGRQGRVGGWGHHIGDEGSGYAIGLDALRRVARHADGRAPQTHLQGLVLDHLGLERVDGLVHWAAAASKAEVAALAAVVADASERSDEVAGEILVHAVEELEGHVLAILKSLGPWEHPPTLALAGGLLRPGRPLRAPLLSLLGRHRLPVLNRPLDPATGAARLALRGLDQRPLPL
ncbi:MAG TPA: BadF/BadG/BcrA/BcrD ATPase family protein [Longimicrobiales bacterium]|nr:BadF/BadG/BcrA/BcrD ATPase family protein [Longimicrobiales bacterium]